MNACSCLTLILACIVYWQAREISRIAAAPDFPFDPELIARVSPIEWKNVVLYGEIKIDPNKLRIRGGDRLCIIQLDRLGRSLKELLEIVADLETRGIHLVSLEERLDTSSAAGELVFHVFSSIAHFERRLISERTRDGIAAARKRGRHPGRPPLYPETVSAAPKLIEADLSPARAAKQLGIGRATAYRLAAAMRDGASAP